MNDPQQSAASSAENVYLRVVSEIHQQCPNTPYFFRGQSKIYDEENTKTRKVPKRGDSPEIRSTMIKSTLLRQYLERPKSPIENQDIDYIALEKFIVDKASQFFPGAATLIEKYTLMRHFETPLLLIDFTRDLNIALYFACHKNPEDDGELFLYRKDSDIAVEIDTSNMVEYAVRPSHLLDSKNRVLSQKSVFIHSLKGYIDVGENSASQCISVPISQSDKTSLLNYLDKYHQIHKGTAYNDLLGFISHAAPISDWIDLSIAASNLPVDEIFEEQPRVKSILANFTEDERTEVIRRLSPKARKAKPAASQTPELSTPVDWSSLNRYIMRFLNENNTSDQ